MNLQNSLDDLAYDLADLEEIAFGVTYWPSQEALALKKYPLAYISCLLDRLHEQDENSVDVLAEKLAEHLPLIELDGLSGVVATYLNAKSPAI